jgi:hypothetical protein
MRKRARGIGVLFVLLCFVFALQTYRVHQQMAVPTTHDSNLGFQEPSEGNHDSHHKNKTATTYASTTLSKGEQHHENNGVKVVLHLGQQQETVHPANAKVNENKNRESLQLKNKHRSTDSLTFDKIQFTKEENTTTTTTTTTTATKSATQNPEHRTKVLETPLMMIPRPRFLLGIMSHDLPGGIEKKLRNAIRDSYLSYFKDFDPSSPNRICALNKLLESDRPSDMGDCQLAYAFVIGGGDNHTQPTELLNVSTSSEMTLSHPEPDVVSLNIKENGKFGKSPTWFKFATLVRREYNLPIDYIIKTDSDTLMTPKEFFDWIDKNERTYFLSKFTDVDVPTNASSRINNEIYKRERIYGGSPFDRTMCGWPSHEHCENLTAPVYMGGAFYFVSTDLSDYISGPDCPRKKLFIPHEDVTMGNYVFSYPDSITTFKNPRGYFHMWRHPLKRPKGIFKRYSSYLLKNGFEGVNEIIKDKRTKREKEDDDEMGQNLQNRISEKMRTTQ